MKKFEWASGDATAKTIGHRDQTLELSLRDPEYGGNFRLWWSADEADAFCAAWIAHRRQQVEAQHATALLATWGEKPHE